MYLPGFFVSKSIISFLIAHEIYWSLTIISITGKVVRTMRNKVDKQRRNKTNGTVKIANGLVSTL